MNIEEKVNGVIKIYHVVDTAVHEFKKQSGLRCLHFCSRCCCSCQITATPLELLPLGYWLHKKKMCQEWLIKIEEAQAREEKNCILLKFPRYGRDVGRCMAYKLRPLICRLFGFSAVLNKNSQPQLITCQVIKKVFNKKYLGTLGSLVEKKVPVMKNYYMMLYSLDPVLAKEHYPLMVAFQKAIEMILFYFNFPAERGV